MLEKAFAHTRLSFLTCPFNEREYLIIRNINNKKKKVKREEDNTILAAKSGKQK
jgi:hypothetical protein